MFWLVLLSLPLFFLSPNWALAQHTEEGIFTEGHGEAEIFGNDVSSARLEAIARAKWDAIEKAVGLKVKAQTVVQNGVLLDEAIHKQVEGVVRGINIKAEGQEGNTYRVTLSAFVVPSKAKEALSALARNTTISVFLPASLPGGTVLEANPFSEPLINALSEQGYQVVDLANTHAMTIRQLEEAIRQNRFLTLRSLMYQYLSNVLLVGIIDFTVTGKPGDDIGYGVKLPFNTVAARLTYRLIAGAAGDQRQILASGYKEGKGGGMRVEPAAYSAMKDLARDASGEILGQIGRHLQANARKVRVRVEGLPDVTTGFRIKEVLQNIAWVTEVKEVGLGAFEVTYPEATVYLAASLSRKPGLKVIEFSDLLVRLRYRGA